MPLMSRKKITTILLIAYWLLVCALARIPIPGVVYQARVSDKTLHFTAYLILTLLFWFSVRPDRKVNWRKATPWWVFIVIVLYSLLDELSQSWVGRTCDMVDFAANLAGSVAGLLTFTFLTFWPALLAVTAAAVFALSNLARANIAELLPVTNLLFHFLVYGFVTCVWVKLLSFHSLLKCPQPKWFAAAATFPIALLALVKTTSTILGRYWHTLDIAVALAAIALVITANYLASLYRKSP